MIVNCFYDSAGYNWLAERRKIMNGPEHGGDAITCLIVDNKQQATGIPSKEAMQSQLQYCRVLYMRRDMLAE